MKRIIELDGGADEEGHEALMFVDGERFGEKVGQVVGPLSPNDAELCLCDAITNPVKAHVHGLGALELHGVVGNANSTIIVTENDGLGLWVAKVEEHDAEPYTKLRVDEHGAVLGLRSGGNNDIEGVAETVDGAIDVRRMINVAEIEVSADDGARFGTG